MFKASTRKNKKYMYKGPLSQNKWVHFGDSRYQQYKDSTPLKLYKHLDHGDRKRREAYFKRHSGTALKAVAISRAIKNGSTSRILSHTFLW